MKNEFIFKARDLFEKSISTEIFKYWAMKYLNGFTEGKDYQTIFYHQNPFGRGIPRKDYLLTEKAKNIIELRMKTPYSIYGYVCPITEKLKYIGCSINEYSRLTQALNEKGTSEKIKWINDLKSKKLIPNIILLDVASDPLEAEMKEQQYIDKYRGMVLNGKNNQPYRYNPTHL